MKFKQFISEAAFNLDRKYPLTQKIFNGLSGRDLDQEVEEVIEAAKNGDREAQGLVYAINGLIKKLEFI
jgi:hypothetical protein